MKANRPAYKSGLVALRDEERKQARPKRELLKAGREFESPEISVAIPNDLVDVSKGRFLGETDLGHGSTRWDWRVRAHRASVD